MGSVEAMKKGSDDRYFGSTSTIKVAQGVSGHVQDKGSLRRYVPYIVQGLRHGMQDIGAKSAKDLHENLYNGTLRFELRSCQNEVRCVSGMARARTSDPAIQGLQCGSAAHACIKSRVAPYLHLFWLLRWLSAKSRSRD